MYSTSSKTVNFKVLFDSEIIYGCQSDFERHFEIGRDEQYSAYSVCEHEKIFLGFSHLHGWTDFLRAEYNKELEKQFQEAQRQIDYIIGCMPDEFKGVCEINIFCRANCINVSHVLLSEQNNLKLDRK